MKNCVIFVGGVHGVGKTTICKRVSNVLKIPSFSSSDLIAKYNSNLNPNSKYVENVSDNQDALISAIDICLRDKDIVILDGHFCLLNKVGEVKKVPMSFVNLSPEALIFLYDSPANICNKIKRRDRTDYPVEFIKKFQAMELEYSVEISKAVGSSILKIDVNNSETKIVEFVKRGLAGCEKKL